MRNFTFSLLLFLFTLLLSFGYERPNVVLILADDLGWGDLGSYSESPISTPSLDLLAESGIRFTDAYVTSPVCGPSRIGLLTGAYQNRFGVFWNQDVAKNPLPEKQMTVLETFRKSGYRIGVAGKWNLNADIERAADDKMDIMFWGGDYWPQEDGSYIGVDGIADGKVQGVWGPVRDGEEYLTDRLTRKACAFIESNKDEPFFLYLAYNAPHSPLHGKKEHLAKLTHLESEPERLYASMVMAIDEGVGKLCETIEGCGLEENTIFIFLSDNGPTKSGFKNYKEEWPELVLGSTGPLSGTKGTFLEGGIRVPFIVRWPKELPSGIDFSLPVSAVDLYPTLCAAAGIHPPSSVLQDGLNILPFLKGNSRSLEERSLYWTNSNSGAIRQGSWKLYYPEREQAKLFNLSDDVGETTDLSRQFPDEFNRLHSLYSSWIESFR